MLKRNKKHLILTTAVALLPMVAGLLLWNQLPDTMATHFDFEGNPNGYSSKAFTVFGLPLIVTACHLLCAVGTANDPRRKGVPDKVYRMLLWICPLVSLLCGAITYAYAFGVWMDITRIIYLFMGCLFVVVGNYLPKCRRNSTVGIKIPWTLFDDDNWNRTHRLAGGLWMVGGAVLVLDGLVRLLPPWSLFVVIGVQVIVPVVYSFCCYKRHGQKEV